jgi:hypothetical protein
MKFLCLCLALVACGGKIDGDDGGTGGVDSGSGDSGGGTKNDAQVTKDTGGPPTTTCTPITGGGTAGSDGSCASTASWSCGDTKYTVECSCPKNVCSCTSDSGNSSTASIVTPQSYCPGCSSNLPAICGFPTK